MDTFPDSGLVLASAARARRGAVPGRGVLVLLALLLTGIPVLRLPACSIPVCYYALENWPADTYRILVSSKSPIAGALRESCEEALGGGGTAVANAALSFIEEASLPDSAVHLAVRFPAPPASRPPLWTGPLPAERLRWIVDSPVRARLVGELLRGAAAVFLFLPAGDPPADSAARARLQSLLDELSRTLAWPPADPAEPAHPAAGSRPLRFPILDVPRQDPAEEFLRAMLLASEPDLASLREPMVFPVFGRGRVLYAIVGAGINREVLADACVFLTGACSCQVKEQNPGVDLLLRADWEQAAGLTATATAEPPPLSGLPGPAGDTLRAPAAANPAATALPPKPPCPTRPAFARRTLVVAAAALGAVLACTFILLAATRSR